MSELPDYETAPIACPGCGEQLDGHLATEAGQSAPDDGSVAICVYCSTIAVYATVMNRLQLIHPTDDELQSILKDPAVTKVIEAMRTTREGR